MKAYRFLTNQFTLCSFLSTIVLYIRTQLLQCHSRYAALFLRRLLYTSVTLMTLFDSTLALVDIQPPGIFSLQVVIAAFSL